MWSSIPLSYTRRNDTPGLSLPVREVSLVVDDDVASLTSCLRSDNTLGRDNLPSEGGLVLVGVDRDRGLVPVRLGLQEILCLRSTEGLGTDESGCDGSSGGDKLLGGVGGFNNFDSLLGSMGGWGGTGGGKCERSSNSGDLSEGLYGTYGYWTRNSSIRMRPSFLVYCIIAQQCATSRARIFFYSPSRQPFSWSRWPYQERHQHCKNMIGGREKILC